MRHDRHHAPPPDSVRCRLTAEIHTLANGLRAVVLPRPELASACVSVYVRAGSLHESRRLNGIGHVIEHMVFKGSTTRDARRINLDAERLGAEVDAYTDKDHTAFQLRGLAEDGLRFIPMLADLVLNPTFPADELERERQVLLHEFADDADDPVSTAFKLFDMVCWGRHPLAQPVIGTRANLERFSRDELAVHLRSHYAAANTVVVVAGGVDSDAAMRAIEHAFAAMPPGTETRTVPASFQGGVRSRRLSGSGQLQVMMGWPLPALGTDGREEARCRLAAAVLGEGMSSPLMEAVRERKGLAYYVACSADLMAPAGQFVVEASTAPEQLASFVDEVMPLLARHADRVDDDDLQRARHQLRVRQVRAAENLPRQMEDAALDLFFRGALRTEAERRAALEDVDLEAVRRTFEELIRHPLAMAVVGPVTRSIMDRLPALNPSH
jgi:predicted Zn-dependent peptidase